MSTLTEALERIVNWWRQHPSDNYASVEVLEPGLTHKEIERRVTDLPFRLPKEVYKLYQWRNGTYDGEEERAGFFDGLTFLSLEAALDKYDELIEDAKEQAEDLGEDFGLDANDIWDVNWFPLFQYIDYEDYYFLIGENIQQETSPVFAKLAEYADISKEYSSLTKMMLYLAEKLESKDNRKI
jgi:cell wall assembly regulator SMI1